MTVVQKEKPPTSTRRPHRHRWVIPVGFVWAMSLLVWVLVDGVRPQSYQVEVVWLSSMLTALGLMGTAAMSGELDVRTALARLKLGPWTGIGFSFGFGLATLSWLGDMQGDHGRVSPSSLVPAAAVAGAGFIAFLLAHRVTPRLIREGASNLDRLLRGGGAFAPTALGVWALWTMSMLAFAVSFSRGNVGYLSDPGATMNTSSSANEVLSLLAQLGLLATLIAGWRVAVDRRPGSLALLLWVASSQVVLGLFSGMKEAAIIQLVAVVVGYSARGRLRWTPLVIAGCIALFVVTPFVTAYRTVVLNGSGRLSPTEALQTVRFDQLIGGLTSGDAAGGTTGDAFSRLTRIGDVAIIVQNTPTRIDYISPVALLTGPALGFVPRSLWPGKPVMDAGYQVYRQYWGGTVFSSAAVTPYGDLYRRGGVLIVIIGMSFLGMFVRTVDDRDSTKSDLDPRLLFLPMLLFTTFVKQEMDFLMISASLAGAVLTAALAARLVSRRTVPMPVRSVVRQDPS